LVQIEIASVDALELAGGMTLLDVKKLWCLLNKTMMAVPATTCHLFASKMP
jgi:hypothetical protein